VLGLKTWERQDDILNACEDNQLVAVRSGHKVSKSLTAACVGLWFFSSFEDARVIVTAPTAVQIRRILWRELRLRSRRANVPFPHVPETPATGITSLDGSREIVGVSTDEAERMQGFSSPNMLYIIDEGSGVSEAIFEAVEGNLAGGARVLMLGNPTQPSGTFYDAFNKDEVSQFWKTIHVSSWEAARSKRHIQGMATLDWCDKKLRSWGPDDPRYQVRVMGDFADYAECAIIPLSYIMAAQGRYSEIIGEGRLELGVDVARFGDDETVVAVRRGQVIIELVVRTGLDGHKVADLVHQTAERHHIKGEQKALVKVDAAGEGLGVVSILRNSGKVDVIGIHGNEPSDKSEDFINKRAQLWFGLSDWLRDGGAIPKDSDLEGDLLAPRFEFSKNNKRQVEDKKNIKKRLQRSPDRGDAVCLAVYTQRVKLVHTIPERRVVAGVSNSSYRWGNAGRGY